jgi:hypothetical protein
MARVYAPTNKEKILLAFFTGANVHVFVDGDHMFTVQPPLENDAEQVASGLSILEDKGCVSILISHTREGEEEEEDFFL